MPSQRCGRSVPAHATNNAYTLLTFPQPRLSRYGTGPRAGEGERLDMSEGASGPVRFTGTGDEPIDWLRIGASRATPS